MACVEDLSPRVANFLQKPESGFLPAFGTKEFLLTLNELCFIATELHQTFGPLFNPAITADAKTAQLEKLATKIKRLDAKLAGTSFLVGDKFGVADAYAYIVLSWAPFVGASVDAATLPNVVAFSERVKALPSVQSAHAHAATSPSHAS